MKYAHIFGNKKTKFELHISTGLGLLGNTLHSTYATKKEAKDAAKALGLTGWNY